jgi:ribonuclease/clavin/mitogillin
VTGRPVRRIELKYGIVLHPIQTRPLPPATHTNCYVVGEREVAILDPGSHESAELDTLFALLDALGEDGRKPHVVLLTHDHPDHTGGADVVRARYGIPIAAHASIAGRLRADIALNDGDPVALAPGAAGAWTLRAIHTPGHSAGHLCFLHERTRSLFTGDHIPGGTGTVIIDPPDGDMAAYVKSLERLLGENVDTLFPGHGSPQGGVARRIRALIAHRRDREARVLAALGAEPQPLEDLVPLAYADTRPELWRYAERSLTAHLLKLEAEGLARRDGERWRRA